MACGKPARLQPAYCRPFPRARIPIFMGSKRANFVLRLRHRLRLFAHYVGRCSYMAQLFRCAPCHSGVKVMRRILKAILEFIVIFVLFGALGVLMAWRF